MQFHHFHLGTQVPIFGHVKMGTFAKSAHKKAKWPEMAKLTGIQRYDQQVLVMGSMGTKTTHVYGVRGSHSQSVKGTKDKAN